RMPHEQGSAEVTGSEYRTSRHPNPGYPSKKILAHASGFETRSVSEEHLPWASNDHAAARHFDR
ncbi:MAG: hypothetical protein ABI353_00750, partial [Isosphaeraceae bacterium]